VRFFGETEQQKKADDEIGKIDGIPDRKNILHNNFLLFVIFKGLFIFCKINKICQPFDFFPIFVMIKKI